MDDVFIPGIGHVVPHLLHSEDMLHQQLSCGGLRLDGFGAQLVFRQNQKHSQLLHQPLYTICKGGSPHLDYAFTLFFQQHAVFQLNSLPMNMGLHSCQNPATEKFSIAVCQLMCKL